MMPHEQRFGRIKRDLSKLKPMLITNYAILLLDPPLFAIDWHKFNDVLTVKFHNGGFWVYINRSNRFDSNGLTVPIGFFEQETYGQ